MTSKHHTTCIDVMCHAWYVCVNISLYIVAIILLSGRVCWSHFRFLDQVQPVLVRIRGVRLLWSEVEQLRAESYRQDNKEHEDMLLEVTNQMPNYLVALIIS